MADNKATSEIKVNYNGGAAQRGLNKLQGSLGKTGSAVGNFAKRFGPAAVATTLLVGTVIKLKTAMAFVQERTEGFEHSLSKVRAILKPTANEFSALTKKAKELGSTTAFTAGQAADAFVELGKLGLTTNEILESSDAVLSLAAAAQVDLAEAATITAQTLAQFSLDAEESTRVTDVMAKSFNISALDMTKFSESMKFAGPVAAQLGISLEETTAAIAEMASQGVHGSMAGTALRKILLALGDESSIAGRKIGLVANDTRTFAERLAALQSKQMSPGEIKKTFGLLAATSAGILIKGADNVKNFTMQLEDAEGTAKEMADTMLDDVAGATKILESAQESLAIAIGESFGGEKQKRIENMTALVIEMKDAAITLAPALRAVGKAGSAAFNAILFPLRLSVALIKSFDDTLKDIDGNNVEKINNVLESMEKIGASTIEINLDGQNKVWTKEQLIARKREILDKGRLERLKGLIKKQGEDRFEEKKEIPPKAKKQKDTSAKEESNALEELAKIREANIKQTHDGRIRLLRQQEDEAKELLVSSNIATDENIAEVEKFYQDKRNDQWKKFFEARNKDEMQHAEDLADIETGKKEKQKEADQNAMDRAKVEKDILDQKISDAQAAANSISSINSSLAMAADAFTQRELRNLDTLNLSDKEREEKKTDILKEAEEKARAFARVQQGIIIAQTIANTAAMAVGSGRDTFGGPITRGLAMAASIASGLAQVAVIQAQHFATGRLGDVERGRQKDDIPALLGRGETVVPAPQSAMHQDELRAIMNNTANTAAGVRGGGNTMIFQGVSTEQMLEAQLNISRRSLTGTRI